MRKTLKYITLVALVLLLLASIWLAIRQKQNPHLKTPASAPQENVLFGHEIPKL